MTSFKAEVIADSSGWTSNSLRFGTEADAQLWVDDLARRWTLVADKRVVPSDDPVNSKIENGELVRVETA